MELEFIAGEEIKLGQRVTVDQRFGNKVIVGKPSDTPLLTAPEDFKPGDIMVIDNRTGAITKKPK